MEIAIVFIMIKTLALYYSGIETKLSAQRCTLSLKGAPHGGCIIYPHLDDSLPCFSLTNLAAKAIFLARLGANGGPLVEHEVLHPLVGRRRVACAVNGRAGRRDGHRWSSS